MIRRATAFRRFQLVIAVVLSSACGCSMLPSSGDRDGLKLADPSPAFMKKVDRDPFPRANGAVKSGG